MNRNNLSLTNKKFLSGKNIHGGSLNEGKTELSKSYYSEIQMQFRNGKNVEKMFEKLLRLMLKKRNGITK